MKNKRKLTEEERYALNYMAGARMALIYEMRGILIKVLHIKEKEHGRTPDKATIRKINREIDAPWMGKVVNVIYNDKLSPETFYLHYDRLFLAADNPRKPEGLKSFDKFPLQGITGVCE